MAITASKNGKPTTSKVKAAILELEAVLREEYGEDFAYQVAAQGHMLGASSLVTGKIEPKERN